LLVSAVEHLLHLLVGDIKDKISKLGVQEDRRAAVIDLLWESVNGPFHTAWVELVVASRTDPYLRDIVLSLNRRTMELVKDGLKELFPDAISANPNY
jgi:hypothetical protein